MDFSGKTIVLTGATSGIGLATARILAGQAGLLILHGPEDPRRAQQILAQVRASGEVEYVQADYTELAAVAELARRIRATTDRVDLLINNAARAGAPARTMSPDGHEVTFQTNYLAPVALTTLLEQPTRVVNVVSSTHLSATLYLDDLDLSRHRYAPDIAYAHSKLALVTETCRMADTLEGSGVSAVSIHPGVIDTALLHAMFNVRGDTPEHAAANLIRVAQQQDDNGAYYDEQLPASPNPLAREPDIQRRLHELTTDAIAPLLGITR
jgi:NAD(P)-dependent dehydrogenase (short-subunit alcohol dehydrogenase family)